MPAGRPRRPTTGRTEERTIDARRTGQLLLVLGFAAVVIGCWAAAQYRFVIAGGPYFARPFGVAVHADGTIFVGANQRHVYAYRGDGHPLRGWSVDSAGGVFRLRLTAEDTLEVAPAESGELHTYDLAGALVSSRDDADAWTRFGGAHDRRFATAGGVVIELAPGGIVRAEPEPPELLVASAPWPLAAMGSEPILPVVALVTLGAIAPVVGVVLTARGRRAPRRA